MGYNLRTGNEIKLKKIANPDDLPPGSAIITDDLFHTIDLSNSEDHDSFLERALAIKFNPGTDDLNNIHIYCSVDGGEYEFMGQTGAENLYYFVSTKTERSH